MVNHGHEILCRGVTSGGDLQARPALLQMNQEDFPTRLFATLSAIPQPAPLKLLTSARAGTIGSNALVLVPADFAIPAPPVTATNAAPTSVQMLPDPDADPDPAAPPLTLYQPVHRVLHVAVVQLNCNTVGSPRLDPTRVLSAGLVIRRVVRNVVHNVSNDDPTVPGSRWTRTVDGQLAWRLSGPLGRHQDPDPAQRPQPRSGQTQLDRLLAAQARASSTAEIYTPAFVAPPEVCKTAGRTLLFGFIPTASSDATTTTPPPPQYDPQTLRRLLPPLLRTGSHHPPAADQTVDYRFMVDDFATASLGRSAPAFISFTSALRLLHTVANVFDPTNAEGQSLVSTLNKFSVYTLDGSGARVASPMGDFYQTAAAALISYVPTQGGPAPTITMPHAWDPFTSGTAADIRERIVRLLQTRSAQVIAPAGRFQDPSRLYRLRLFVRVKSDMPGCPPQLVWSKPSVPFRIAAWHECAGRPHPPVPLPDPQALTNLKPNCSFAVPGSLMSAMQGSTLSGLSSGSAGAASGTGLNWICGFNIPLITICAFFVLNIFLIVLNLCFFWLPFIKICIPFPASSSASSGDQNGT